MTALAFVAVALYAPIASTASPLPGSGQVAAGGTHTCAIRDDGTLACWGDDSAGQLDGVPSGTFRSLSAGGTHTCAIRTDGTLACWGDDSAGQLDGVPSGAFLAVAAGGSHTCAIRDDGTLACWGDDSAGQLDGVPSGTFRSLSAGGTHTCAIRTDGTLACWGDDSAGQLYEAPEEEESSPVHPFWWWYFLPHHHRYHPPAPPTPPKFLSVAAGGAHTCAVSAAGELSCWGDDSAGQLDELPSGEFVAVSAGRSHSCAIRADGTLACWGDDSAGQLDSIPAGTFLAVTTGGKHSCATTSAGEIDCWGDNGAGQAQPLMLATPLAEGKVGTPYDHRFETTPQAPVPTFSIASGQLPAGLELTPDGDLTGTPIEAGSFQFTVTAANGLTADAEEEVALTVVPPPAAPVQAVAPQDTGLPNPVGGVNVNLEPAGGIVKTKCPGDSGFVPLTTPEQVPLGCQVDTGDGVVNLTAAKLGEEGFESAYFWGGTFAVGQSPGETELKLAGKLKCEKRKSAGGSKRGSRIALRSNSGGGRKLWGSGKGNFKTSGNYGSATVRGTVWLVHDRCDNSTQFGVREGVVTVDDFVKGTSLFLYPGQRYVAKAAIPRLR